MATTSASNAPCSTGRVTTAPYLLWNRNNPFTGGVPSGPPEDILTGGAREPKADGPRAGFEGSTWFRINAGRRHRAEARWLLPLICRYGHVTRNDIGAIRIAASESYFEIAARAVPGFRKALSRAVIAPEDEGMRRDRPPRREGGGGDRPRRRDR